MTDKAFMPWLKEDWQTLSDLMKVQKMIHWCPGDNEREAEAGRRIAEILRGKILSFCDGRNDLRFPEDGYITWGTGGIVIRTPDNPSYNGRFVHLGNLTGVKSA